MAPVEVKVLVQRKDSLDSKKAVEFVKGCSNAGLVVIYYSVRNDQVLTTYLSALSEELKTPFLGVRVSGTVTLDEGYTEDSIALAVLCGVFEAKVFREKLGSEGIEKSAENMTANLEAADMCFVYSATYLPDLVVADAVLRRINRRLPNLTFFGGGSAPKPLVACNEGVFEDSFVYAALKGAGFDLGIYTGFAFDTENTEEYLVTKSDEFGIYAINDQSAAGEYSRIQRLRPYFFNTLSNLFMRPDMARVSRALAETNSSLYEVILKCCIQLLGSRTNTGEPEPMTVFSIDEKNGKLSVGNYKKEGTTLKRINTSKEAQMKVYEKIGINHDGASFMFINACAYASLWLDFDYKTLMQKLRELKHPILMGFFFGEYGTSKEEDSEKNITHNCMIESLEIN